MLRDQALPAGAAHRVGVPIAGDDDEAKRIVAELTDEIGFDAVDAGSLAEGRRLQPGSPVYAQQLSASGLRRRLGVS